MENNFKNQRALQFNRRNLELMLQNGKNLRIPQPNNKLSDEHFYFYFYLK